MNPEIKSWCFIVMGVSGSGKSSVARALANESGGRSIDADDYHTQENREKMERGIPLEDEDREAWLDALNRVIQKHEAEEQIPLFLACSALKESYRQRLLDGVQDFQILYLHGEFDLIQERLKARPDHFMSPELLESQFDALEEPEKAIWFDIIDPVEKIAERFFRQYPELQQR